MGFSALPVRLTVFVTFATLLSMRPAAADDADTCTHGSGDDKIAACTRAITSGRWTGSGLAWAYVNRGKAYREKGDYDHAIQDYDQAIRLDPKNINAYNNRGNVYKAKGDNDRAVADYSEAIGLNPKSADAYFNRGRLYLYGGSVAMAQADFKQANALKPKDSYAALWLDFTERRNNVPSHLAEAAKQLDMTAWPAPVVRLFLGQTTTVAVFEAAQNADARTMKGQVCEANFYSGELALLLGAREEAVRLLRLAAKDCPATFTESEAPMQNSRC
jgi:lipoprotein NlpI